MSPAIRRALPTDNSRSVGVNRQSAGCPQFAANCRRQLRGRVPNGQKTIRPLRGLVPPSPRGRIAGLGPIGIAVVTMPSDNAPLPQDLYEQFIHRINLALRVAYELGRFAAVWFIAYQTIVFKRDLLIAYEAASAGTSAAQILDQQKRLRRYAGVQRGVAGVVSAVADRLQPGVSYSQIMGRLGRSNGSQARSRRETTADWSQFSETGADP
jgi:hypothetical protein